jgi:hypothetical protein
MGFRGAVFGFLIGESLAARSGIVCAECDLAKPVEPIASRFEMRGDTVYDRRTGLTWMRCSYGQAWTESRGLLRRGQTPGLGRGNGIALARKHRLETSPEGRVGEHCSDQLQAARDRRNGVSRYAVDSVLDEHADRPVLCLGGVLSDRHVDVEFPPHDALCCSAGANWPMNDTAPGMPLAALSTNPRGCWRTKPAAESARRPCSRGNCRGSDDRAKELSELSR